jgi:hypothetical protein
VRDIKAGTAKYLFASDVLRLLDVAAVVGLFIGRALAARSKQISAISKKQERGCRR